MTVKVFRIKDWEKHYENNRTRELKKMDWVRVPNSHDGEGYCQMVKGEFGTQVFGAWVACIQVASRCEPRGTLMRKNQTPHTAMSLAERTRLSVAAFEEMLRRAMLPTVNWIELVSLSVVTEIPHSDAESPHGDAAISSPPSALHSYSEKGMQGEKQSSKKLVVEFPIPPSLDTPEFRVAWADFKKHRAEKRDPLTPMATKKQLSRIEPWGVARAVAAINFTIANGWTGIYEEKGATNGKPNASNRDARAAREHPENLAL